MSKKNKNLTYVEDRLIYLKSIKQKDDLIDKQKVWKQKNKTQRIRSKALDKSDFKTDLAYTVKTNKDAELLAGMQEYDFIPLDGDSRRRVRLLKEIWTYWWLVSRTDKQLSKVIPEATAYWTWWMYEWIKTVYKEIKVPYKTKEWTIEFENKTVLDYDWIYCEYIPWENLYIDWTDIDNSNEAVWIKFWDRESFKQEYKSYYSNLDSIPDSKTYSFIGDNLDIKHWMDDDSVVAEVRYYNKSKDEFIVLANWIEVLNSAIPFTHKELPFCPFLDYQFDDRLYGAGEYEILEEEDLYKDALRSLSIDVIKAQMGIVFMEEDSDFDVSTFEYWPTKYSFVNDINWIKHFAPSISTSSIDNAEIKLENDVVAKTGINYRNQQLNPSETAEKTKSKAESARKMINKNLKINGYSFFERLARLRLANIKLIHSVWEKEIFIKWANINSNKELEPLNWGYGSFTVTPDDIKWEYSIVPITSSILGEWEEKARAESITFIDLVSNIKWQDGNPVVWGDKLVEMICERFDIDYEDLIQKSDSNKNPEDIIREVMNEHQWVSNDTQDPNNPNFIPPEQRSGATTRIASQAI